VNRPFGELDGWIRAIGPTNRKHLANVAIILQVAFPLERMLANLRKAWQAAFEVSEGARVLFRENPVDEVGQAGLRYYLVLRRQVHQQHWVFKVTFV